VFGEDMIASIIDISAKRQGSACSLTFSMMNTLSRKAIVDVLNTGAFPQTTSLIRSRSIRLKLKQSIIDICTKYKAYYCLTKPRKKLSKNEIQQFREEMDEKGKENDIRKLQIGHKMVLKPKLLGFSKSNVPPTTMLARPGEELLNPVAWYLREHSEGKLAPEGDDEDVEESNATLMKRLTRLEQKVTEQSKMALDTHKRVLDGFDQMQSMLRDLSSGGGGGGGGGGGNKGTPVARRGGDNNSPLLPLQRNRAAGAEGGGGSAEDMRVRRMSEVDGNDGTETKSSYKSGAVVPL
jgi:hypothetical protein